MCGDSSTVAATTYAAFEQIADTQLVANLCHVLLCAFVAHDGSARDDAELGGLQLAELSNHLFGETIGKIIFIRIPAQIDKGKHRKHGLLRGGVPCRTEIPRYQDHCYG